MSEFRSWKTRTDIRIKFLVILVTSLMNDLLIVVLGKKLIALDLGNGTGTLDSSTSGTIQLKKGGGKDSNTGGKKKCCSS